MATRRTRQFTNSGPIASRLNLMGGSWANDIPLKFLWALYLYPRDGSSLTTLGSRINDAIKKYEVTDSTYWPVKKNVLQSVTDDVGNYGLLLAQNVALPSDGFNIASSTIDGSGGFLPGPYAGNRLGYGSDNKMDVTFLETNLDIIDYFIRPWIIACSYKGLIEDGVANEDLKCNAKLLLFSRDKDTYRVNNTNSVSYLGDKAIIERELTIRKSYEFLDVTPFQVSGDQLSYGELGINDVSKTVSFAFNKYRTVKETAIPGL